MQSVKYFGSSFLSIFMLNALRYHFVSVKMQDLSKQNERMAKKIKIQQKKIEMFKKKIKKQKAMFDNKENIDVSGGITVSSADGSLDVSAMSALSIVSPTSSLSSCNLSGNHRKSKKRKYGEISGDKSAQQLSGRADGDKCVSKRIRIH